MIKKSQVRAFKFVCPLKNWAVHGGIGAVTSSELAVNPDFSGDRPGGNWKMEKENTEG